MDFIYTASGNIKVSHTTSIEVKRYNPVVYSLTLNEKVYIHNSEDFFYRLLDRGRDLLCA